MTQHFSHEIILPIFSKQSLVLWRNRTQLKSWGIYYLQHCPYDTRTRGCPVGSYSPVYLPLPTWIFYYLNSACHARELSPQLGLEFFIASEEENTHSVVPRNLHQMRDSCLTFKRRNAEVHLKRHLKNLFLACQQESHGEIDYNDLHQVTLHRLNEFMC